MCGRWVGKGEARPGGPGLARRRRRGRPRPGGDGAIHPDPDRPPGHEPTVDPHPGGAAVPAARVGATVATGEPAAPGPAPSSCPPTPVQSRRRAAPVRIAGEGLRVRSAGLLQGGDAHERGEGAGRPIRAHRHPGPPGPPALGTLALDRRPGPGHHLGAGRARGDDRGQPRTASGAGQHAPPDRLGGRAHRHHLPDRAIVGAFVFGFLTDRLGRKKRFLVTLGWYTFFTVRSALSVNFLMFALFRALTGMGIGGEYSAINSASTS
ncbi:MAG TPA: MFS transporter [Candidatus Dormibacteraeota bacterium]|nr:MFS transporter [Candidatus Dormibacteraeota bacterium]